MLSLLKKRKQDKLPARLRGNSCLNCNDSLNGDENFCPSCGQRNNIKQLSFKLFVNEFFGDMFSYDSRLWGTVIPLILKPGKVAYEFVLGKRKEYVNPFRTYLTVSLIFFIVYGLLNTFNQYKNGSTNNSIFNFTPETKNDLNAGFAKAKSNKDSIAKATLEKVQKEIPINLDSTFAANNISLDSIDNQIALDSLKKKATQQNKFGKKLISFYDYYGKHKEHTAAQAFDSLGYKNTIWNRFYYDKAQNVKDMIEDEGEGFGQKIFSGLSLAIFFMLPVLALSIKLIYIRRKYTYMEHMVFVFYTQAVFFLLLLLFLGVYYFSNGKDELIFIPIVLFILYLLLAMKRFYKQGWFKTFFKFLITNFMFIIISSIGFVFLILISFILY
jgi:hypothetical protein